MTTSDPQVDGGSGGVALTPLELINELVSLLDRNPGMASKPMAVLAEDEMPNTARVFKIVKGSAMIDGDGLYLWVYDK